MTEKDLGETGGGTLGWLIKEDQPDRQLKKEGGPPGRELVREYHSRGLVRANILHWAQAEVAEGAQNRDSPKPSGYTLFLGFHCSSLVSGVELSKPLTCQGLEH